MKQGTSILYPKRAVLPRLPGAGRPTFVFYIHSYNQGGLQSYERKSLLDHSQGKQN